MPWLKVSMIEDVFEEAEDGSASATRKYYCEYSTVISADAPLTASAGGTSVPARGSAYSSTRPYCAARTYRVDRKSPSQFNVEVGYIDPSFGGAVTPVDLLALPAVITRTHNTFLEAYEKDETKP